MSAWLAVLLALAASGATPARAGAPADQELDGWVRRLDAAQEPEWTQALEHLARLGEPAAERILADFEDVDFTARRARAKLLLQVPAPALCARVLGLLDDPDPQVRRILAHFVGSAALARTAATERVEALERLVHEDPSDYVRAKAREALLDCALEEAVPALERALERLPADEAEKAAAALAQLPAGRARLIARLTVHSAAGPGARAPLSDGVHAALLAGYGRALAEVPGGGEELRERLPFLLGRTHRSLAVQSAARSALAGFVARAAELAEAARADRVLQRLGEEGWPRVECLRRRLDLAWLERGDAAVGLELARALWRASQALFPEEAEGWELRARLFEGAALYALGQRGEAEALFVALGARIEAGLARRVDQFPGPSASTAGAREDRRASAGTQGGGSAHIDRLHLAALVHLWRALLGHEARPGAPDVLEELRSAHLLFLESRVVAMRTDAPDPATLDSLLDRDLSPYTLVLLNERMPAARRGSDLDKALALGAAWGQVAPLEVQGLGVADAPERRLGDVFFDPARLTLLKAMRAAQRQEIERRLDELRNPLLGPADPDARQNQTILYRQVRNQLDRAEIGEREALGAADPLTLASGELRSIYAQLLEYLAPCMHAHTLAGELRGEGRTREARELCERALATLRTAPLGSSFWSELSSARFELLRGSTLMDEGRPREAEETYLGSERRLAAIEKRVEESSTSSSDPDSARQTLAQIRAMRGEALLSLAVNANVRMGDPARALEFFERAYDLNPSPFMRVLRACYRARSGKGDEARTVLASVVPVPALYYNLACTYALLGEKEPALDYLQRDFRENHPTPGSLAQKREWARKDPDLASLRDEARFKRLLGGP